MLCEVILPRDKIKGEITERYPTLSIYIWHASFQICRWVFFEAALSKQYLFVSFAYLMCYLLSKQIRYTDIA